MNADTLRENIRRCKQLTDKPFGVNIMLMHQMCIRDRWKRGTAPVEESVSEL